MRDRVPTEPGRVLITPEGGGAPYYAVVVRADGATETGTPLNKGTLLSDATAGLFGLVAADAVPDDIFRTLAPQYSRQSTSTFVRLMNGRFFEWA